MERLFAPEARFARGFFRYWRELMGQAETQARESAAKELAIWSRVALSNLSDPAFHTIGIDRCGEYQPIGLFALRDLQDHPQGRILAEVLASGKSFSRYRGKHGMAHAVALLDEHARRTALETILLSIAHKAIVAGFSFLFFFVSDPRLRVLYRRFGMDFPEDLRFRESAHIIGVYDPYAPANRGRMVQAASRLGVMLGPAGRLEPDE